MIWCTQLLTPSICNELHKCRALLQSELEARAEKASVHGEQEKANLLIFSLRTMHYLSA